MDSRFSFASLEDMDAVGELYRDTIDHTQHMETYGRWKRGLYPTRDGILAFVREGSLCLLWDDGEIVGAMALLMRQGEDYHAIPWAVDATDDEVSTVHVLAVRPSCQGKGVGKILLAHAVTVSRDEGKKAVRLDVLDSNAPAQRLYESMSFLYRGKMHLYAANTGFTDFRFYELAL